MARRSKFGLAVLFFTTFMLAGPTAHAYIDAITGSFLFQLLAGGLIAVAVGLKLFGKGVWSVMSLRFLRRSKDAARVESGAPDG